jgi:hypothetical protein
MSSWVYGCKYSQQVNIAEMSKLIKCNMHWLPVIKCSFKSSLAAAGYHSTGL